MADGRGKRGDTSHLNNPVCVIVDESGTLYVPDWKVFRFGDNVVNNPENIYIKEYCENVVIDGIFISSIVTIISLEDLQSKCLLKVNQ